MTDLQDVQRKLADLEVRAEDIYNAEAEAKCSYVILKNQEKNNLATLMLDFQGPQNAREQAARASQDWLRYQEGLTAAECAYVRATADVKAMEARIRILQSLNKPMDR